MKSKLTFLFYFIIFASSCLPQDKINGAKLNEYFKLLQSYQTKVNQEISPLFEQKNKLVDSTQEKSLKKTVKAMYEAIEESPVELEKENMKNYKKLSSELKEDLQYYNKNRKIEPIGTVHGTFLRLIDNRYPKYVYYLTRIPIFMKAKVVAIKSILDTFEIVPGRKISSSRMIMKLQPEIIIKGKNLVQSESEFEVYFRYWEQIENTKDFKIGKSYLIPAYYRGDELFPTYAIATWLDDNGGRYLVESNSFYDEKNTFGMGNEVNWDDFVKVMNNRIFKIKNMLEY